MKADIQKYFPYVVFVLAVLLYFPTLKHQYAWDDALVIHGNELTKKGFSGLAEIWTSARYIEDRPTYRPIPQTLFAIEWALAPNNPRLAHFTNIILYGLCCLVLFSLLKRWFSGYSPYLILFISMLFVLHPVHTEVVSNIKSRDEILAGLFSLLAMRFLVNYNLKENKPLNILLFSGCITMGILSKISAITILPFLAIIFMISDKFSKHFENTFNYCKKILLSKRIELIELILIIVSGLAFYYLLENPALKLLIVIFTVIFSLKNFSYYIQLLTFLLLLATMLFFDSFAYVFIFPSIWFLYYFSTNSEKKSDIGLLFLLPATVIFLIVSKDFDWKIILPVLTLQALFLMHFSYWKIKSKKIANLIHILILLILLTAHFTLDVNITFVLIVLISLFVTLTHHKINSKNKIIFIGAIILISSYLALFLYEKVFISNTTENFSINEKLIFDDDGLKTVEERYLENQPFYNILVAAENTPQKLATIARVQWLYIQKLFYPHPLVHQYGAWQIELASFKNWDVWFSIIIHLLLIVFVVKRIRKKCPIAIGILFYLVTVSIYTNIIYLMPDTMAERFMFLPSVGFCVALVFGLYQFGEKWLPKNALTFTGLVLLPFFLFFAQKSWSRSKDWKDNFTLTAKTVAYAPNNAVINAQYGAEVKKLIYTKPEEAQLLNLTVDTVETYFKKALEIYPEFYNVHSDLGVLYIDLGEIDSAFPHLRRATELNKKPWINHYYLGLIYYERQQYYNASNHFKHVIENAGSDISIEERTNAYEYMARSLFVLNKPEEIKKYLLENYDKWQVKSSIVLAGNLLAQKGRINEALEIFYRLKDDFPDDEAIQPTIEYLIQYKN